MATTIIYANEDSETRSDFPDTNYGGNSYFTAGYYSSWTSHALVGFDISSLVGKIINSVTLYAYVYYSSTAALNLYRTTGSWSEYDLTWNNEPAHTTDNSTSHLYNSGGYHSVDITNMFKDETGSKFSVKLIMPTLGKQVMFKSRSHWDNVPPYIYVDYVQTLNDVYVNPSTGNDANAGDSCVSGHPVQTFQKAYDILNPNGVIHVCNSGADFSGETVTLTKGFSITVDGDGYCYLPKLS